MEIVSSFLSFFLKKITNFVKQITLLNSPSHLCKIFRFLINFTKIYHLLLLLSFVLRNNFNIYPT